MRIQPGTFEYILSGPPSRYLAPGDSGSVTLRDSLASLGFKQTSLEDAVRAFQLKHNAEHPEAPIKVDGKAGIQTLNAIYAPTTNSAQLHDSVYGRAQFLRAKNHVASMIGDPPPGAVRLTATTPEGIKQALDDALKGKTEVAPNTSANNGVPNGYHLEMVKEKDGTPVTTTKLKPDIRDADAHPMRVATPQGKPADGDLIPNTYDVNGRPMRERTDTTVTFQTRPADGELIPNTYDVNGRPMRERTDITYTK